MKDKMINCIQCDELFDFSASDQKYFAAKGFDEPTRCPECRKRKKLAGNNDPQRKKKKKHNRKVHHDDEWY